MASEYNIKAVIREKFGLDISGRAMKIFIAEYQIKGEDFVQTKQRIRGDWNAFYDFLLKRTDIPLSFNSNQELLNQYLEEIDFVGRTIVSMKNYSVGNSKIKEALPEMIKIYNDYQIKIIQLAKLMNLPDNFASSRIKSRHLKN
ncbi:MAG: hypothetical protein IPI31_00025 [Bacteroidetes bacterium]|nr:hypothetical protein [Bacteroidota bacterium]